LKQLHFIASVIVLITYVSIRYLKVLKDGEVWVLAKDTPYPMETIKLP